MTMATSTHVDDTPARVDPPRTRARPVVGSPCPTSPARARSTSARSACASPSSTTARSALGVRRRAALVELRGDSSAPAPDRRATGLFHLAILLPTRLDLALALARLAEARWPLDGASDHLVSEALYLSDPDGNGIEIYRDRPREDWRAPAASSRWRRCRSTSTTCSASSRRAEASSRLPAGTRIGHVHLQVSDSPMPRRSTTACSVRRDGPRLPGRAVRVGRRLSPPLGLNTWHSAGAAPPPGAVGLRSFEIELPERPPSWTVLGASGPPGSRSSSRPARPAVRDPSGNRVVLT